MSQVHILNIAFCLGKVEKFNVFSRSRLVMIIFSERKGGEIRKGRDFQSSPPAVGNEQVKKYREVLAKD